MERQTLGERIKRTSKKVLRIVIALVVITLISLFSFYYWGVYEDGVMAGRILRISTKGVAFKTYEGKIDLQAFGALKNASPIAESFDFSVEKNDTDLIKELETVALSGERVNLYFIKRYAIFPWRGETRYFATRIERLESK